MRPGWRANCWVFLFVGTFGCLAPTPRNEEVKAVVGSPEIFWDGGLEASSDEPLEVRTPYGVSSGTSWVGPRLNVVLGQGPGARIQPLEDDGTAEFEHPGPPPYTVTLVMGSGVLRTKAEVFSRLVEFESAPSLPTFKCPMVTPPARVVGTVHGALAGRTVRLELWMGGAVLASAEALNQPQPLPDIFCLPETPSTSYLIATEWAGTELKSLGVTRLDDFELGGNHPLEVTLDEPLSASLEPRVANWDPLVGPPQYRLMLVLDGRPYTPGGGTNWPSLRPGTGLVYAIPEMKASLQEAKLRLTASTAPPGDAQVAGQSAWTEVPAGTSGAVTLSLLSRPQWASAVGTGQQPAFHPADSFALSFAPPAGHTGSPQLQLSKKPKGENGCAWKDSFLWRIELPTNATHFAPFELPQALKLPRLVTGELGLSLSARRTDAHGEAQAQSVGQVRVEPLSECSQTAPPWAMGEFVGIDLAKDHGPSDQCLVDDFRLKLDSCGALHYSARGGDFFGSVCGEAESVGDTLLQLFSYSEMGPPFLRGTRSLQLAPSARQFRKQPGVLLAAEHTTMFLVRKPAPAAVQAPPSVAGLYRGVTVRTRILEEVGGAPGRELMVSTVPADGSHPEEGAFVARLNEDGTYEEAQQLSEATHHREGRLSAWNAGGGTLVFTNGPGMCSDLTGQGQLTVPAPDLLELTTTRDWRDRQDLDGDGSTEDTVLVERVLSLVR